MQEHQIHIRNVAMWVLGMVLCPLGVTLSARAGFGLSMVEAPVYILYLRVSQAFPKFTFGMAEYIVQALVLAMLCILIRKFRARYLLSFATAVMFGVILDGWRNVIGEEVYAGIAARILACAAGILLIAFAVTCFFRTDLPQEVWEMFVKEYSTEKEKKMTKVKWIYDITSLVLAVLLSLILLKKFEITAIGPGTVASTILNAPLIGLFGRLIDTVWKDRENVLTPQKEREELKKREEEEKRDAEEDENIIP
jgi:uncharacterized membrane protein YczE